MSVLPKNNLAKAAIAAAVVFAAAASYLMIAWNIGLNTSDKIYVVKRGVSLKAFVSELHHDDVLSNRFSLIWLAYITGQHRGLKAGEYRFDPGTSQRQLLDKIVSGDSIKYKLLIPEGWNFAEVMLKLNESKNLSTH